MTDISGFLNSAKKAFIAGDLAAMERFCRSAIAAAPGDARAWMILSDAAMRRGHSASALSLAEKALALEPRNPFSHLLLAQTLARLGKFSQAGAAAEAGVAIQNCPVMALEGFRQVFSQIGNHRRTLDIAGKLADAEPGNAAFLVNLATAEQNFGALDKAELYCDRAIACDPSHYSAYLIRSDLRVQTAARNHAAEMEGLIERGLHSGTGGGGTGDGGTGDGETGEILLRFALAKEYEDLGDYARGFRHLKAGADLQRRGLRYDMQTDKDFIDRIVTAQTGPLLASLPDGHVQDDPIFIVGLPRSGTTLIERIIGTHGAVTAAGELDAFQKSLLHLLKSGAARDTKDWGTILASMDLPLLGRAYCDAARDTGIPSSSRFTDKFPPNFLYCGAIHAALPKAKIIALKRQPMDSCYAVYKTYFRGGAYPYSYDLEELGEYYLAFRRMMDHWSSVLPKHAFLEVAYEDIVFDLEGQSRRILDFLGLPWDAQVLSFHENAAPVVTASAAQVRRPLYSSSIGKWRRYESELEPLRKKLAAALPDIMNA